MATERKGIESVQVVRPNPAPATRLLHSDAANEHIRGSSLLLAGRIAAYGLEFGAQVLMVRYLSKSDFGAFAYALSIIVALKTIAVLELPNTMGRFIPLYRERGDYRSLLGSIALAVVTIVGLGMLLAAAVYLAVHQFGLRPTDEDETPVLMVVLALLIPLEGLDALLTTVFAALAGARQIAFRQVFAPALKMGVVLVLISLGSNVVFLAAGYVVVAAANLLVYFWLLLRVVGAQPWMRGQRWPGLSFPAGEIFGFALPLLTSTLVWLLMESSDAVLLGIFQNSAAVASFRAVLPIPKVLSTLTITFAVLYTPIASRLYARGQHLALADLYRRTALWMSVLTFPIFALAFGFASSVTIGFYGQKYADSTPILALLSLGYYFFAITGFNGLTLKIYNRLRFAVGVDVAAAILNVMVNLLLIPQWGAVGAAIGTAGTMIVHNGLKQYGLWRYLGINLFERRYAAIYGSMFLIALALLGLQMVLPANLWLAIPIGAAASVLVVWIARGSLQIDSTFPEARDWPIAGYLLRWFS